MAYKFKGYDWYELAECWGITSEEMTEDTEDKVLAEKVKQYIWSNLERGSGFKDKQIKIDLENFLKELIKESEKSDYNAPVYKAFLKVENDEVFAKWICNNLELLWT